MNNETLITSILGGIAFLCFLPFFKVVVKSKPQPPPLTLACETPDGWKFYKTNNLRVHRNGTWNFTDLSSKNISASNCFLGK